MWMHVNVHVFAAGCKYCRLVLAVSMVGGVVMRAAAGLTRQ